MLLPSKELLSKVLRVNVKFIEFDINEIQRRIHGSARENDLYYHDGKWKFINIYELDHKCKEWATSKGYQFRVYIQTDGEEEWQVGKCGYGWDLFACKSIQEACEWIMEQKK